MNNVTAKSYSIVNWEVWKRFIFDLSSGQTRDYQEHKSFNKQGANQQVTGRVCEFAQWKLLKQDKIIIFCLAPHNLSKGHKASFHPKRNLLDAQHIVAYTTLPIMWLDSCPCQRRCGTWSIVCAWKSTIPLIPIEASETWSADRTRFHCLKASSDDMKSFQQLRCSRSTSKCAQRLVQSFILVTDGTSKDDRGRNLFELALKSPIRDLRLRLDREDRLPNSPE